MNAKQYLEAKVETKMRFGLERMQKALTHFKNPDHTYPIVVVGGTNGKGSVTHMIASIFAAQGLKVGTYTSPHLSDVKERILLCNEKISADDFERLFQTLMKAEQEYPDLEYSYFEALTLVAALYFKEQNVDLAVFEVGLGGRLDACNALKHDYAVITAIDYDHTEILGSTLEKIATEKAHIISQNAIAVVYGVDQTSEIQIALSEQASKQNATLITLGQDFVAEGSPLNFLFQHQTTLIRNLSLPLKGDHQIQNAALAIAFAKHFKEKTISTKAIVEGLKRVRVPGRMECWVKGEKKAWVDIAHNPQSFHSTLQTFANLYPNETYTFVVGMLERKEWQTCLNLLKPKAKTLIITPVNHPQTWHPTQTSHPNMVLAPNPALAITQALELNDKVFCLGSFYLIGEVRETLTKWGFEINAAG